MGIKLCCVKDENELYKKLIFAMLIEVGVELKYEVDDLYNMILSTSIDNIEQCVDSIESIERIEKYNKESFIIRKH